MASDRGVAPLLRSDELEMRWFGGADWLHVTGYALFRSPIDDFYLTNPIARASAVMAECSRLASGKMLTAAE